MMVLFSLFIFVLSSTYVCGINDEFKSSLTFAIDHTYSMRQSIDEIREKIGAVFDTVLSNNASQIKNFVLVTFGDNNDGDPGVTFHIKTTDREHFINSLSAIQLYNGGDCPENSLSGIKRALEESEDRSYVYVFTDAAAKDFAKYEEVKSIAQQKQSQVMFVLTGICGGSVTSPNIQVYYELARATNGEVFQLHEAGNILNYIKKTLTGRRTTLISKRLPPDTPGRQNMIVFYPDVMMDDIIVSLTCNASCTIDVTIMAFDGSYVDSEIILMDSQVQVYSITTRPGANFMELKSNSETRVVISAKSGLDFQHGFSAYRVSSLDHTTTRPVLGLQYHLLIKHVEGNMRWQTVEILDMDYRRIRILPILTFGADAKLYSTPAFIPPSNMFQIMIEGYDSGTKSNATRSLPIPVEPQKIISEYPKINEEVRDISVKKNTTA